MARPSHSIDTATSIKINDLLAKKNMTQKELAIRTNVAIGTITRYVRHENLPPSIKILWKIADLLESDIDYLVGRTDINEGEKIHLSPNEQSVLNAYRKSKTSIKLLVEKILNIG